MRLTSAAIAVMLTSWSLPAAAYPIIGSEEHLEGSRSSVYTDGYWVNGAGTVFTHYQIKQPDSTWGPIQELRDFAVVQPKLATGDAILAGVAANGVTQYYNGDGSNLLAHQTNYGWDYGYLARFDGSDVLVDVQITLDWDPAITLTDTEKSTLASTWEHNIESWWNGRYWILKDENLLFDLVFDLTYDGYPGSPRWDQHVYVNAGSGRATMTNWFATDGAQTNAHEFGHMLGLFDEYWSGAINTATRFTSPVSLMGAAPGTLAVGGGLRADYFQPFADWLDSIDPDPTQTFRIMLKIAEPNGAAAALAGLLLFGLWQVFRRSDRFARITYACAAGGRRTKSTTMNSMSTVRPSADSGATMSHTARKSLCGPT